MSVQEQQRHYPSTQYLLPADQEEALRLNGQHRIVTKAFEDRLFLAPLNLMSGDKVLESAAGSGIWAIDFSADHSSKGIDIDIECIDITAQQYPEISPPNIHFSVHSITSLPPQWTNTFSYAHQRLIVLAMNDALWRSAIKELFRVLKPGGWLELVEFETKRFHYSGVGPSSEKLCSVAEKLFTAKGIVQGVSDYLRPLLAETGFVDIDCQNRDVPVGGRRSTAEGGNGYTGEQWGEGWMGVKVPVLKGGGYGVANTSEEFDALVQASVKEWNESKEVYTTFYTIAARKPASSPELCV
ncbi:hypothetical protein EV360DRAFT_74367 [Lentinula raphanica]|nr:hypothetical protein EV360DRAFT_74367 [Lentinula raphanica]